jgi:hypothetical protein
VIAQNQKLFPAEFRPSLAPLPRIAVILAIAFAGSAWTVWHDGGWSITKLIVVATSAGAGLFIVSFFAFGLKDVQDVFVSRMRRRFAPAE